MKVASKQAATAACLGLNFNFGFYLMGYGSVRILRTSRSEKRTVLGQLMRSVGAEAKERATSYGPLRQTRACHCDIACFLADSDGLGCACVVEIVCAAPPKQARARRRFVVSPEIWSILTTGIVILIAIAASNRSLRRETGERIDGLRRELGARINGLSGRVDRLSGRVDGLGQQVDGLRREMHEHLGDVRERLGRVEGLLEGLGFARNRLHGKERAGKGPSASPAS